MFPENCHHYEYLLSTSDVLVTLLSGKTCIILLIFATALWNSYNNYSQSADEETRHREVNNILKFINLTRLQSQVYQTSRWTLLATKCATKDKRHSGPQNPFYGLLRNTRSQNSAMKAEWSSNVYKHQNVKISSLCVYLYRFLPSKDDKRIWNTLGKLCCK